MHQTYRTLAILLITLLLVLPIAAEEANDTESSGAEEVAAESSASGAEEVAAESSASGAEEVAAESYASGAEETAALAQNEPEETATNDAPAEAVASEPVVDAPKDERPYSPMIDTRLSFVFADDDLLSEPGTRSEPTPGPQFRATDANTNFMENYNGRDTGFETLSHLVLYAKQPTHFEGLTGEAALVLRMELDPGERRGSVNMADSSSYVRLSYRPKTWQLGEEIAFTGFPVTSDRFRLGYSYRLTWGGDSVFPGKATSVPGARIEINRRNWYGFMGAKTTVLSQVVEVRDEQATDWVANYGFLSGVGFDLGSNLRMEFGGGYFTKGNVAKESVFGEKMHAAGGTTQISWRHGREVGTSVDLRLYRNDPETQALYIRAPEYGPGVSYYVATEFSWLGQTLEDPDTYGSTNLQHATAGDVNVAVQQGFNRYFLDVVFRDMSYILFNVPSFVPFQDFSSAMNPQPEGFVALGYDRYLERLRLTPGFRVGIQRPAHAVTDSLPTGNEGPQQLVGERTVVIRERGNYDILPQGSSVTPIMAFMGTARLNLSDTMIALGQVSFQIDHNRATIIKDTAGLGLLQFQDPYRLGFNLMLQARF